MIELDLKLELLNLRREFVQITLIKEISVITRQSQRLGQISMLIRKCEKLGDLKYFLI